MVSTRAFDFVKTAVSGHHRQPGLWLITWFAGEVTARSEGSEQAVPVPLTFSGTARDTTTSVGCYFSRATLTPSTRTRCSIGPVSQACCSNMIQLLRVVDGFRSLISTIEATRVIAIQTWQRRFSMPITSNCLRHWGSLRFHCDRSEPNKIQDESKADL